MSKQKVIDIHGMLEDLRLALGYASRAGLVHDQAIIDVLKQAEATLSNQQQPDISVLAVALNRIVQVISPITLADLRYGRDPFALANQTRGRVLQLCLTIFALVMLILIGYFMDALRTEQEAISTILEIKDLRPELKLNALRKLAQDEQPVKNGGKILYDEYHQKIVELNQMNARINTAYQPILDTCELPLFPLSVRRSCKTVTSEIWAYLNTSPGANTGSLAAATSAGESAPGAAPAQAGEPAQQGDATAAGRFCSKGADGNVLLPDNALPDWMQSVLTDALNDMCFQQRVLSPNGMSIPPGQLPDLLVFLAPLKEKVALRVTWFLPFFYGLLGAVIYLMRNIASVRTPAMEWFPVLMRLALGGIAGIVMGWFSASTSPGMERTGALSIPFALAFLTGYGIDVLFTLLDKLNSGLGETQSKR